MFSVNSHHAIACLASVGNLAILSAANTHLPVSFAYMSIADNANFGELNVLNRQFYCAFFSEVFTERTLIFIC